MSARLLAAHFGALQQRDSEAPPRLRLDIVPMPWRGWPSQQACFTTGDKRDGASADRAHRDRDALADRREAEPLTHRQTLLIVLGVLLPTFMGSLDQTILATALPTIGRDFGDMPSLPW